MKRLRTIKYISETPIEEMVKGVFQSGRDIEPVIEAALESRKEYGIDIKPLIHKYNNNGEY